MDSNFEKVDAHQINKIVFSDWTLPSSTDGDIQQIVAVHLLVSWPLFLMFGSTCSQTLRLQPQSGNEFHIRGGSHACELFL